MSPPEPKKTGREQEKAVVPQKVLKPLPDALSRKLNEYPIPKDFWEKLQKEVQWFPKPPKMPFAMAEYQRRKDEAWKEFGPDLQRELGEQARDMFVDEKTTPAIMMLWGVVAKMKSHNDQAVRTLIKSTLVNTFGHSEETVEDWLSEKSTVGELVDWFHLHTQSYADEINEIIDRQEKMLDEHEKLKIQLAATEDDHKQTVDAYMEEGNRHESTKKDLQKALERESKLKERIATVQKVSQYLDNTKGQLEVQLEAISERAKTFEESMNDAVERMETEATRAKILEDKLRLVEQSFKEAQINEARADKEIAEKRDFLLRKEQDHAIKDAQLEQREEKLSKLFEEVSAKQSKLKQVDEKERVVAETKALAEKLIRDAEEKERELQKKEDYIKKHEKNPYKLFGEELLGNVAPKLRKLKATEGKDFEKLEKEIWAAVNNHVDEYHDEHRKNKGFMPADPVAYNKKYENEPGFVPVDPHASRHEAIEHIAEHIDLLKMKNTRPTGRKDGISDIMDQLTTKKYERKHFTIDDVGHFTGSPVVK